MAFGGTLPSPMGQAVDSGREAMPQRRGVGLGLKRRDGGDTWGRGWSIGGILTGGWWVLV